MDKFYINAYLREIEHQKKCAIKSYNDFQEGLQKRSTFDCFFHIHHFLTHVANIVKITFPGIQKNNDNTYIQARAKLVRSALKLEKTDFERKYIAIRNDFEHYDERIDTWAKNSKRHNYCDMNIGPKGSISGLDQNDMFRNYDQNKNILSFYGKDYDLNYFLDFLYKKLIIPNAEDSYQKTYY